MSTREQTTDARREALLARLRRGTAPAAIREGIRPRDRGVPAPATPAQEALWVLHRLAPDRPDYNVVAPLALDGPLDVDALRAALDALVARHEALRTVLREVGGRVVQVVDGPSGADDEPGDDPTGSGLVIDDATPEQASDPAAWVARHARVPLSPEDAPLFRPRLLRIAADRHVLLLLAHHAIVDGPSFGVLLAELDALYADRSAELPPLPVQFADLAVWQHERLASPSAVSALDRVVDRLGNDLEPTRLPLDGPGDPSEHPVRESFDPSDGPKVSPPAVTAALALSPETTAALHASARAHGATPFMALTAAVQGLLHRWDPDGPDAVVGTPVAGRDRPELAGVVGYLVGSVVLRSVVADRPGWDALLGRTAEDGRAALADADVPFEHLVARLRPDRDGDENPLFRVLVSWQQPPATSHLGDVRIGEVAGDPEIVRLPLEVYAWERDGRIEGRLLAPGDRWSAETVRRAASQLEQLVDAALAAPERPLLDLDLDDDRERATVRAARDDDRARRALRAAHDGDPLRLARPTAAAAADRETFDTSETSKASQPRPSNEHPVDVPPAGLDAPDSSGATRRDQVAAAWALVVGRLSGRADVLIEARENGARWPLALDVDGPADAVALVRGTARARAVARGTAPAGAAAAGAPAAGALASVAAAEAPTTNAPVSTGAGVDNDTLAPSAGRDDTDFEALLTRTDVGLLDGPAPANGLAVWARLDGDRLTVGHDPAAGRLAEPPARTAARLARALRALADAPDAAPSALDLLGDDERAELAGGRGDGRDAVRATLPSLVLAQAHRTPDAVAVADGDVRWSYRELVARTDALAARLRDAGAGPGTRVLVALPRTAAIVPALLAVVATGAAYLPIDPEYPADRIAYIVGDAEPIAALVDASTADALPPTLPRVELTEDAFANDPRGAGESPTAADPALRDDAAPESPAYIIYTSGSTGNPKGVLVPHRALVTFLAAMQDRFALRADDRLVAVTTIAFDIAGLELFLPLITGARVVVAARDTVRDPAALGDLLLDAGATIVQATPTLWRELVRRRPDAVSGLRMLVGGEALPAETAQAMVEHGAEVTNLYGPTETTIWSTAFRLDGRAGAPPIGRPIRSTRAYVLDARGRLAPTGATGELFLGGAGVTLGYHDRPELTAERFVADPFAGGDGRMYATGDLVRWGDDGELEYLGRRDDQVKVRGFRIELGEIQAAMESQPGVADAAVGIVRTPRGDDQIVGYVVPGAASADEGGAAAATAASSSGDHGAAAEVDDAARERVASWSAIYDDVYAAVPDADLLDDISVWRSVFDGRLIGREAMDEWRWATVRRVLATGARRVLEVGAGNGLILSLLAPHCDHYVACELSPVAADRLRARVAAEPELADRVEVRTGAAHETDGLATGFDAILLSSVVQYFPDAGYLRLVLERLGALLRPGGALILADLRDRRRAPTMHVAAALGRASAADDPATVLGRGRDGWRRDGELCVDPHALVAHAPTLDAGFGAVELHLRAGRHHNEMTQYRFDAVLHRVEPDRGPDPRRCDWASGDGPRDLDALEALLAAHPDEPLLVAGIPDARIADDVAARNALAAGAPLVTALGALTAPLPPLGAVDPEQLLDLAAEHDRAAFPRPGADPETIDLLVLPRDGGDRRPALPAAAGTTATAIDVVAGRGADERPAGDELPARVLERLRERLPAHAVPSAIVVLDRLPLTPNGKVDRAALPKPGAETAGDGEPAGGRALDEVETALLGLWREALARPDAGPDDDFFALGGSSLRVAELTHRIHQALDVRLPLRAVFDQPTVTALAPLVRAARDGDAVDDAVDLVARATLDETIRPAADGPSRPTAPRRVLLTGAAGFLGAQLLVELLRTTGAEVECLVRAADDAAAHDRVLGALRAADPDGDPAREQRLRIVAGDVSAPRLGLDASAFSALAERTDLIVHAAARPNLVDSYDRLEAANVDGTRELLRLATTGTPTPLHHVSTDGVLLGSEQDGPIAEDVVPPPSDAARRNGYLGTKWVAEALVREAGRRGLPVTISRPGRIGGAASGPWCPRQDALWSQVRASIELGVLPDVPGDPAADAEIDLVPVDHVAALIVRIALRTAEGDDGTHFHLGHPRPTSFARIGPRLRAAGYDLMPVPGAEWAARIADAATATDAGPGVRAAAALVVDATAGDAIGRPDYDRRNADRVRTDSGLPVPELDDELLDHQIRQLVACDVLPAPSGRTA